MEKTASGNNDDSYFDLLLNPFQMHHSHTATSILVTQPLVGADNYNSWKRVFLIALAGKNKDGFINGTIEKPTNEKLLASWKCNNHVITSWILNSVSKEISASIVYTGTAKDVWDELAERFKESNGPCIFQLRKELANTFQGSMSIEAYFTKIKTVWQDLVDFCPSTECSCGALKPLIDHLNTEYVMIFLMGGLNESYAIIRTQILLMDPLPSINKVFSLIIQEERQRNIGNSSSEAITLMSSDNSKRNTAVNQGKKKEIARYTHCRFRGHTVDKCYRIHGFPPGFKSKRSSATSQENNSQNIGTNSISQNSPNFWDSLNSNPGFPL